MSQSFIINGDQLKKLQEIEMSILAEVADFCNRYGIQYFLSSGTLLGAVRHKGFIPWDDDIDISMPRKDFERFLDLCDKLPQGLECQATRFCSEYPIPIVKVRKNGTIMKEPGMASLNINHGVWIDIFPIDKVANPGRLKKRTKMIHVLTTAINYKLGLTNGLKMGTKMACILLGLLSVHQLDALRTKIMTAEENIDSGYFTNFASNIGSKNLLFSSDVLFPLTKIEFEGKLFQAPAKPDTWLTGAYGDYMQLPPIEKRINRHKVMELKI